MAEATTTAMATPWLPASTEHLVYEILKRRYDRQSLAS